MDFEVTVNGEYTNLPNGVSLPIHLERTDNFGYYSADFNIPDGVSPDSVGVYRGFG